MNPGQSILFNQVYALLTRGKAELAFAHRLSDAELGSLNAPSGHIGPGLAVSLCRKSLPVVIWLQYIKLLCRTRNRARWQDDAALTP